MDAVDTFKGLSSASMTCSEDFIFNLNDVNIFLPNIVSYLHLAESYGLEHI